ncbi:hypothetical protein PIB30_093671 [Stylosanthes scabra]|uniref:Uncharacterized protein n=1 Tax=Stylosanthes scabra TaxID=79078 RepID=A0ABU6YU47_9FABA|nr:hypothetical protein [Stylosanthes scabra]
MLVSLLPQLQLPHFSFSTLLLHFSPRRQTFTSWFQTFFLKGGLEAAVREVEAAPMPHELPSIYHWVAQDVLGSLSTLTQGYLIELMLSCVIFGGREEDAKYREEALRPGDRICFLNLDHPTIPNWLWVNKVMFTKFGVKIPLPTSSNIALPLRHRNCIQMPGRQFDALI